MTEIKDLSKKERDILRLVQSQCHIGSKNYNNQMMRFISRTNKDGSVVFNLGKTYDKILLAA